MSDITKCCANCLHARPTSNPTYIGKTYYMCKALPPQVVFMQEMTPKGPISVPRVAWPMMGSTDECDLFDSPASVLKS